MTLRKLMDKSEIFSFLFLLDDERSLSIEVSDDTTSLIIVFCLCIQFHINWLKAIVCLPENNDAYKVLNIMTFSADDKENLVRIEAKDILNRKYQKMKKQHIINDK
uniref:Uncharacterized protein n=1 Tax=Glossina palpalis gambiensis TaxID=67801 RepID=A0A1B0B4V0_9MUSC